MDASTEALHVQRKIMASNWYWHNDGRNDQSVCGPSYWKSVASRRPTVLLVFSLCTKLQDVSASKDGISLGIQRNYYWVITGEYFLCSDNIWNKREMVEEFYFLVLTYNGCFPPLQSSRSVSMPPRRYSISGPSPSYSIPSYSSQGSRIAEIEVPYKKKLSSSSFDVSKSGNKPKSSFDKLDIPKSSDLGRYGNDAGLRGSMTCLLTIAWDERWPQLTFEVSVLFWTYLITECCAVIEFMTSSGPCSIDISLYTWFPQPKYELLQSVSFVMISPLLIEVDGYAEFISPQKFVLPTVLS